jgi:hypothetical protein
MFRPVLAIIDFLSLWSFLPTYCRCRGLLLRWWHTHTHTHTLGRTSLDEGSVRRRNPCLTTNNIHKRQTAMPSEGFRPAIPASERRETYPLDRAATWIGFNRYYNYKIIRGRLSTTARLKIEWDLILLLTLLLHLTFLEVFYNCNTWWWPIQAETCCIKY